jgi:hypothetical protein
VFSHVHSSSVSTGDFFLTPYSFSLSWIFYNAGNSKTIIHLKIKISQQKFNIMPSFDFVSKVDAQALDNAVNVVTKEITNRFDFKGSHVVINFDKKEF